MAGTDFAHPANYDCDPPRRFNDNAGQTRPARSTLPQPAGINTGAGRRTDVGDGEGFRCHFRATDTAIANPDTGSKISNHGSQ